MKVTDLVVLFIILMLKNTPCRGQFECGAHGKFEYCVDEMPGCVVGCHCHPGFFFDTDTKQCELNTKLLNNHRRHNISKPTRIYVPSETSSTINNIDGEVAEIKKNADDLGDWLYNQFFKTIESQVINKTDAEGVPTRRKMHAAHKKQKSSEKKIKGKKASRKNKRKTNMKKKIMRLPVDDSAFEISSGSDSDESDLSSSSDTGSESGEHGHKKIIMFQKKKDQPLPSFIFIPNRDTPFYPPLGLPPAPVMPMYPMVPVPPVLPLYEIPVLVSTKKYETSSTATTAKSTTTESPVRTSTEQHVGKSEDTKPDRETTTAPKPAERSQPKNLRGLKNKLKQAAREKMVQYLKAKTADSLPLFDQLPPQRPMNNYPINPIPGYQGIPNSETINDNGYPETFVVDDRNKPEALLPFTDNVNFKYISELIHKIDVNNTNNENANKNYPMHNLQSNTPINLGQPGSVDYIPNRRSYNPMPNNNEESYYSNIGRQIASLIRNINMENKDVDIARRKSNNEYSNTLFLKNNSPATFWERSIRSPLKIFNSNKKHFEYLRRSNELLFNLENKVQKIASTPRSLDLQELENIVSVINVATKEMGGENNKIINDLQTVPKSLNIDLLPQELYQNNDNSFPQRNFYENKIINGNFQKKLANGFNNNLPYNNVDKNFNRITFWQSITQDKNYEKAIPNQITSIIQNKVNSNSIDNSSLPNPISNIDRSKEPNLPFLSYNMGQLLNKQIFNRVNPNRKNVYIHPPHNSTLLNHIVNRERGKKEDLPILPDTRGQILNRRTFDRLIPSRRNIYISDHDNEMLIRRTTLIPERYKQRSYFRNDMNQFDYTN